MAKSSHRIPPRVRADRWTFAQVDGERTAVRRLAEAALADQGAPFALAQMSRALEDDGVDSPDLLRRFCLVTQALTVEAETDCGELPNAKIAELLSDARTLLAYAGIQPTSGRVAFLYLVVERLASTFCVRDGDLLEGFARLRRASEASPEAPPDVALSVSLDLARWALRLGHARLALECLPAADAGADTAAVRIEALRLSDEPAAMAAALAVARTSLAGDHAAFVSCTLALQGTGDVDPLLRLAAALDLRVHASLVLEARLWLAAAKRRPARDPLPKVETVKRKFRPSGRGDASRTKSAPPPARPYDRGLIAAVEVFEVAADNARPFAYRVERVLALVHSRDNSCSALHRLLALAAAVRFLLRNRQQDTASLAFAEYRRLALTVSGGGSVDPLGALHGELTPENELRLVAAGTPDASRPALSGSLARGAVLSRLAFDLAYAVASERVRGAFAQPTPAARRDDRLRRLGASIADKLGELRGVYVKLGQSLCSAGVGIPEPLREALAVLQADLPPLAPGLAWRAVEAELGRPLAAVFAEWNSDPVASASIGQVHWARLKSGEEVAVKIQIPGVAAALAADLARIGWFSGAAQWLMPATDVDALIGEVQGRLGAEIDYEREAANQAAFRALYADDPQIVVPRSYPELSTSRLLISEFLHGSRLADFAEQADKGARDRVGVAIYGAVERAFWQFSSFNDDPHPGNFLVLPDGRVGILDFGSVASVVPKERQVWREVTQALMDGDDAAFRAAWERSGTIGSGATVDFDGLRATLAGMRPHLVAHGAYRFTRDDGAGRVGVGHLLGPFAKALAFPPGAVSFVRMSFGVLAVMRLLEAGGDFNVVTRRYLAGEAQAPTALLAG